MLLGIGIENLIKIKSDDKGKMLITDLRDRINQSIRDNMLPFAVVSTYGITNSGSLDPVDAIQLICDEFKLWHHIDAIYGGAMVLSENQKHLCPIFEKADSISFNPQKWMFVAKTCSVLIFKDFELFKNNFRIAAPYVGDSAKTNLGEIGIQGSRHASVLKLWLSLYLIGKEAYADIIDLNMNIAQSFAHFVLSHQDLELYTVPELNIILFRPKRKSQQDEKMHAEMTSGFQNYMYQEKVYVTPVNWEKQLWLKCIFLNPYFNTNELESLKLVINSYFRNH